MQLDRSLSSLSDTYLHTTPFSARIKNVDQLNISANCCLPCHVVVIAAGACWSIVPALVAVVETITSLACAIFLTSLHVLLLFRSVSLQNHVIKKWAYSLNSAKQILSPVLFLHNLYKKTPSQVALDKEFYRINCAQRAQRLGALFDFFACRKGMDSSLAKERAIKVGIEGTVEIINNNLLSISTGNIGKTTQSDLYQFIIKNKTVGNNIDYDRLLTQFDSTSQHMILKNFIEDFIAYKVKTFNNQNIEQAIINKIELSTKRFVRIPMNRNDYQNYLKIIVEETAKEFYKNDELLQLVDDKNLDENQLLSKPDRVREALQDHFLEPNILSCYIVLIEVMLACKKAKMNGKQMNDITDAETFNSCSRELKKRHDLLNRTILDYFKLNTNEKNNFRDMLIRGDNSKFTENSKQLFNNINELAYNNWREDALGTDNLYMKIISTVFTSAAG